jgi:hypothetical protein
LCLEFIRLQRKCMHMRCAMLCCACACRVLRCCGRMRRWTFCCFKYWTKSRKVRCAAIPVGWFSRFPRFPRFACCACFARSLVLPCATSAQGGAQLAARAPTWAGSLRMSECSPCPADVSHSPAPAFKLASKIRRLRRLLHGLGRVRLDPGPGRRADCAPPAGRRQEAGQKLCSPGKKQLPGAHAHPLPCQVERGGH